MISILVLRKIFLLVGDLVLFFLSLIIALVIGFGNNFSLEIFLDHLIPFLILLPFWIIVFSLFGGYDLRVLKNNLSLISRVFLFCFILSLSSVIFFYLFPNFGIAPKANLIIFSLLFGLFVFLLRKFFLYLFSSHFQQKIAIFGITPEAEVLAKSLKENPQLGWRFVGFLTENDLENLSKKIKEFEIDIIILAKSVAANKKLERVFYDLLPLKINFLDLAKAYEIILRKIPVAFVNQAWFLENLGEGKKEFYDKTKRGFDIIIALLILIITSVLWPFIILAIKLEDRGPIFYKQERVGKDKGVFTLLKFRSMKKDAERYGPVWAEESDSRITKVGKFLRKTHFDELPQMINVLRGELSLVGPRPERPEFVKELEKEIPHYNLRHLIRPGFTGWAQIKFRYARSVVDSFEKLQYDLYYIKNRSLGLDFYILLKTFGLFFRK
jgi:exopolysaccharide biosynthesis polyprenyl glycosylphosphotransferase